MPRYNYEVVNQVTSHGATAGRRVGMMVNSPRSALVRFRFRTQNRTTGQTHTHTADILLVVPPGQRVTVDGLTEYLTQMLSDQYVELRDTFTRMGSDMTNDDLVMDGDGGRTPWIDIESVKQLLSSDEARRSLGFADRASDVSYTGNLRLFGWFDDRQRDRRSFRYLIEGMDLRTLDRLINQDLVHTDCDRMCMYRMLREANPGTPGRPVKLFDPENVNQWLNSNGHAVGGLQDGLSSDHIQAHAQHFRYGHCAMDLSRSVVNLYIPEGGQRNSNLKTVCYVIVGDHCQPIVDASVLKSVMRSASERVGQRRALQYHHPTLSNPTDRQRKRRSRSLDRVYRVQYPLSGERTVQETWSQTDAPQDVEVEDWEEDFDDSGSDQHVRMGSGNQRRQRTYPLAREVDRFHVYEKASEEGRRWIEERFKPTYWEGDDTRKWHYYVCTDADDVEFLYEYLVRKLKIDPMRYARSFNGRCRQIEMQNTLWIAHRDWEMIRLAQDALYPTEPLRLCGLGTYGFRLLHREMFKLNERKPHGIWESMSQYPPNLHRLMDNLRPTNRAKLLRKTFQPPYSDPRQSRDGVAEVLIPLEDRRRMDIVRCYASCLRSIGESEDEYPIHDITNRVVPFDAAVHSSIPVGHYVVTIPEKPADDQREAWAKWSCFTPGEKRVMSHRMLRRMLEWGLLNHGDIEHVCLPDGIRQTTYGKNLSKALLNVVKLVYQHPSLQDPDIPVSKHLINHLVGVCNGTTMAHSGMRYVFHDLAHCYRLLTSILAEDQMRKLRIWHTQGVDQQWNVPFDYYELDSSGLQTRNFHMQPVYCMILEEQAVRMYERLQTIPLRQVVQLYVDAIEYQVEYKSLVGMGTARRGQLSSWCQSLEDDTVTTEGYRSRKPEDLWNENVLGRWKQEAPKPIEYARSFHTQWQPGVARATELFVHGKTNFEEHPLADLDPEDHQVVTDWKATLRVTEPDEEVRSTEYLQTLVLRWYERADTERTGLLVTGPAGTGKTHLLRMIYEYGVNTEKRILRSAFTHSACVQLGFDALTLSSLFGTDRGNDLRVNLIFSRRFAAHLRNLNLDVLMVDEISMIPLSILECLMLFHRTNTHTRIVLGGDFHQLPPVDRQWDRSDDYNFFDYTDVFPYLLFDTVKNLGGEWWRLTTCMRTDDPLLHRIAANPTEVSKLVVPEQFPMPSLGQPIWRFICWRNTTRKACNWYCMERYRLHHPLAKTLVCRLRDVYVEHELRRQGDRGRFDAEYFGKQYDRGVHRPMHHNYLQDYVYAEGMEVVCRNTLREWTPTNPRGSTPDEDGTTALLRPEQQRGVVNNRRGRLERVDAEQGFVVIRWLDLVPRAEAALNDGTGWDWTQWDVLLTIYDFVFNFVPGFCITTHMAQGETIREHYGIMEWEDICSKPKMAYVAVTRGSHSRYLHIVPGGYRTDPWGLPDYGNGVDLTTQLLCRLYHVNRWDKDGRYPIASFAALLTFLSSVDPPPLCERCARVPLVQGLDGPQAPRYLYRIGWNAPDASKGSEWSPLFLTCESCNQTSRTVTSV